MPRQVTTIIDAKHRRDLEEFMEACCYEFLHNVKQQRYSVAEQWLLDIRASLNTLEIGCQTIITN